MSRSDRMRATWDAAAATGWQVLVGDPAAALSQLELLFSSVGAPFGGDGPCLEVGCGTGRMTAELASRWPEVVAVDVSPALLERARERVGERANVRLLLVDGERLDGVATAAFATVVCFGVLQHVPTRRVLDSLLAEVARVLRPDGEAIVQLPVLASGAGARGWRAARSLEAPVRARLHPNDPKAAPAYRGIRLTARELDRALARAGLRVVARAEAMDETLYSRYPHATDVRLRLARRGG